MANNTWLHLVVKLTDKPDGFMARKLVESPNWGSAATGTDQGGKLGPRRIFRQLRNILTALAAGVYHGKAWVVTFTDTGAVLATGAIACTQANAGGKTITFTYGGVGIVLTEAGTGVAGFAKGASDTTLAAALAACINAHPVLGGVMTAAGSSGTCNLTAKIPAAGIAQNIVITTNGATAFSLTQFSGGTPGATKIWPQALGINKT